MKKRISGETFSVPPAPVWPLQRSSVGADPAARGWDTMTHLLALSHSTVTSDGCRTDLLSAFSLSKAGRFSEYLHMASRGRRWSDDRTRDRDWLAQLDDLSTRPVFSLPSALRLHMEHRELSDCSDRRWTATTERLLWRGQLASLTQRLLNHLSL